MLPGNCFRCGTPGHYAAECPEHIPTADRHEHQARLETYRQRFQNWLDGSPGIRWTPEQKTKAITAEKLMYEKGKRNERGKDASARQAEVAGAGGLRAADRSAVRSHQG